MCFSFLDFNQRVVVMILTVFTIIVQLINYAKVCMPPIKIYHADINKFSKIQYLYNFLHIETQNLWFITIWFVLACIGGLCSPKCPHGYYRQGCNENCTCNAHICDGVFGCVPVSTGN